MFTFRPFSPLLRRVFPGSPHEACGFRLLIYVRQPQGGRHCRRTADWLLRELQLRRAYENNDAPSPFVLIIGVQEDKKTARVCEEHACLSSSETKHKTKTVVRHKANPMALDHRSSETFRFLVPEVLKCLVLLYGQFDFVVYLL